VKYVNANPHQVVGIEVGQILADIRLRVTEHVLHRLVHVDDVVNAFIIASEDISITNANIKHKKFSIYGKKITLKEFIQQFCKINNIKIQLNWNSIPYSDRQIFNPFNLKALPNWKQQIVLEEGFSRYIRI